MAKVELKQPIVAEISELLDGAQTAVVVDYRGLTVEQDTILRKHYGAGAGLELRNRPQGGAAVTAVLPVRREEEDGC